MHSSINKKMKEPVSISFGYKGHDLPILSTNDILTESWSLEEEAVVMPMEETRRLEEPVQEIGAPLRARATSDQAIGVTP